MPDITEGIVADGDDGDDHVSTDTWDVRHHYYYGDDCYGLQYTTRRQFGSRFQGIASINSGDTIDLANWKINVNKVAAGGNSSATVKGANVDSASAFSNSNRPENIAATTAGATADLSATGLKTVDVTSIVQEIVNRAGWAANNNMAIFITGGTGTGLTNIDDSNATKNVSAVLEIDYTAAGGGATPRFLGLLGAGK